MKKDFLSLAKIVQSQLANIRSKEELKTDYIYQTINRLIVEVETGIFSTPKTDIGLAAIKMKDMGIPIGEELKNSIIYLDELYRRIQKCRP